MHHIAGNRGLRGGRLVGSETSDLKRRPTLPLFGFLHSQALCTCLLQVYFEGINVRGSR